ncbi:DUF2735 domain-containing protein [Undibacter mobilis]|uniref:DUF2735 domain-containing protein n=1 Tax=Undibacter mobilis TaxID=2292256 RepID=A0A371B1H4_9BRAD|nr:DUF2735 domain-containing protein [Undibacter mobilis]RDV01303.1 DUF2735 domain-containing protein [Undibacter mobilis]
MPTNAPRETARIYQFPVGGRAGLAPRRSPEMARFADMPTISYGSSWYHDEAIREAADKPRKN